MSEAVYYPVQIKELKSKNEITGGPAAVCLFVCQGPSYRLIFNINNKKNKIMLVGASLAPKKESNALIGEIVSSI